MSIYGLIKQRLKAMGYDVAHAKAIIATAQASKECELAKKWWTGEVELYSTANIEVLWESVRKIAARYSIAFLFHQLNLSPELLGLCELERMMIEDKVGLMTGN